MQRSGFVLIAQTALLASLIGTIGFVATKNTAPTAALSPKDKLPAAAASAEVSLPVLAPLSGNSNKVKATTSIVIKKANIKGIKSVPVASASAVERIQNPYTTPALPQSTINDRARAALVNILCTTSGGLVRPISGSGVIIDPRGVILTNAHVAQYVLLSQSARVDFHCYIRTGSPAIARSIPRVLYVPPVWISMHASEITQSHATGTGEHDYALLYIEKALPGFTLPSTLPFLPTDTREAIGFVDDQTVVAGYPAEFLGGLAATSNLYAASSPTTIKQLLTFNTRSIDAISLGGVIEAQSGSSGGSVVNAWGYLIGIITTTSEGATTAERDLRAVTLSYIDRDLKVQTGFDLATILGGDPALETADFSSSAAPQLIEQLLKQIFKQ